MSERIINQFKKLQETGPSAEWTENTRNFLITQVKRDTLTQEQSWTDNLRIFSIIWLKRLVPSSVKVIATICIFALIGGTSLFAQAEYIPNRPLYQVKRMLEKIELVIAMSPESETKVHLKHATKRKDEAVKLAQNASFSSEKKAISISQVVKSLEKEINAAQSSLAIIQETEKETVKLVTEMTRMTRNIQENMGGLDEVMFIADLKEVDKTVSEVQSAIEEVGNESLDVLIEGSENQEEIITNEELVAMISVKITRTENKINSVNQIIEGVDLNKIIIINETKQGTTMIGIKLDIKQIVTQAIDKLAEAQAAIEEAMLLLDQDYLAEAMEKVKESGEFVKETEIILAQVVDVDVEEETEEPAETDSSDELSQIQNNGFIGELNNIDSATTTSETTLNIIDQISNYAPLGGKVNQTADLSENDLMPEDININNDSDR